MKHRNKRGFTLIELLVVIAIIGALSIAIGVNANGVMKTAQYGEYKSHYEEIFKDARIYVEIDEDIAAHFTNGSSVTITLQNLIDAGLIDDSILRTVNPAYGGEVKFAANLPITVYLTLEGKKEVSVTAGWCEISADTIEYIEWGTC